MKGRKVPFEIDDSLKERRDPFTAEEFWSLREGMTVHVLVAPDEMVEGILKCGHASGSLLSFVKTPSGGKDFTGRKVKMVPGNQNTDGRSSPLKKLKSLNQVLATADNETVLDENGAGILHEIQDELDGRT